jgi:hypothetical protein
MGHTFLNWMEWQELLSTASFAIECDSLYAALKIGVQLLFTRLLSLELFSFWDRLIVSQMKLSHNT